MKALGKLKPEVGIWMYDTAEPQYGSNDVLIKIHRTGICGTDIHIYNWDAWASQTVPVPLTVGHEFMGEIVAIGSEVQGIPIGARVSGECRISCGHCRLCRTNQRHLCRDMKGMGVMRPGCFAEYLAIPAFNVVLLPDEISDEVGAVLDPFGNATHSALSFDMVGEDVLITGAGPIGILSAAIAKHIGARHIVITDVNDYRLELARKMGATHTVNVTQTDLTTVMQQLKIAHGFEIGLEMSGNAQALNSMLDKMSRGGKVGLLGIFVEKVAVDWTQVVLKGLQIKGISGREVFNTWYKMLALIQGGLDISPVITHHFPVADYQQAFDIMRSGKSGKVVLHWT